MALTKDQILTHTLGINLFRARNNDIVRVISYNVDLPDDPVVVTRLTGENRGYNYGITTEGNYYVGGGASAHDLVALITADDLQRLQLLTAPKEQPAPNLDLDLDLERCLKNHTYLKLRGGEKAVVLSRVTAEMEYPFKGSLIDHNGFVRTLSWTRDGRYYDDKNDDHEYDIVGLWEERKTHVSYHSLLKAYVNECPVRVRNASGVFYVTDYDKDNPDETFKVQQGTKFFWVDECGVYQDLGHESYDNPNDVAEVIL